MPYLKIEQKPVSAYRSLVEERGDLPTFISGEAVKHRPTSLTSSPRHQVSDGERADYFKVRQRKVIKTAH